MRESTRPNAKVPAAPARRRWRWAKKRAAPLATSGLRPDRLELEITETVLLENNAKNLAILRAIKNLGVAIVLDDFGTGYSSMTYLRMFPFDRIKIDQTFIQNMTHHAADAAIVCAVASGSSK